MNLAALGVDPVSSRAFTELAEARGVPEDTLLRLLVEAFIATHAVGTSARDRTPEQRIADAIARKVGRDGATTRAQAWKSLSSRDRNLGRALLDAALDLGQQQGSFVVRGDDITGPPH